MIIAKNKPKGIDKYLKGLQEILDGSLEDLWKDLKVYGRVYRKYHEDGYTLEHYKGKGEYESLMVSEGNKIFFLPENKETNIGGRFYETVVHIVCLLDLEKSYPATEQRADEEAHIDFLSVLGTGIKSSNIKDVTTGIDEIRRTLRDVFKGAIKVGDIHPYHIFMVTINARHTKDC